MEVPKCIECHEQMVCTLHVWGIPHKWECYNLGCIAATVPTKGGMKVGDSRTVTYWLDEATIAELKRQAKAADRTFSAQVRWLVAQERLRSMPVKEDNDDRS